MARSDPLEPQVLIGEDYPDGGIVVLHNPDLGTGAILPTKIAQMSGETRSAAVDLQQTVREIVRLQGQMSDLVDILRDHGASWNSIGFLVGTSPQAAQKRFGPPDDDPHLVAATHSRPTGSKGSRAARSAPRR